MQVQIPDDSDFVSFRDQCLGTEGWVSHYSKRGATVWGREEGEENRGVQKIKVSTRRVSGRFQPGRVASGPGEDSGPCSLGPRSSEPSGPNVGQAGEVRER